MPCERTCISLSRLAGWEWWRKCWRYDSARRGHRPALAPPRWCHTCSKGGKEISRSFSLSPTSHSATAGGRPRPLAAAGARDLAWTRPRPHSSQPAAALSAFKRITASTSRGLRLASRISTFAPKPEARPMKLAILKCNILTVVYSPRSMFPSQHSPLAHPKWWQMYSRLSDSCSMLGKGSCSSSAAAPGSCPGHDTW